MTDQHSQAQRRRTSRSTTITTATSAAIQTSTQIHSGMVRLLPSGSVAERDGVTAARWWLPARNGLHAALPCGDPDRSAAPHGPAVCLLDGLPRPDRPCRGSLTSMEARSGLRPAPRHPRPVRGPETPVARGGRGPEPDQQAAQGGGPMQQFEQDWLELGRRVAQERGYQSVLFDDPADYA
jgi:hypothetical protein